MTEMVTVRGFVATDPSLTTYDSGTRVTTFRLAATPRYFDRASGQWVNGETNWFSVSCFRELAMNVQCSVKKGEPVLVTGRLRIRQFDRKEGGTGTSVGIEAESVGHDLVLGTATYARRMFSGAKPADGAQPAEDIQASDAQGADEARPDDRPSNVDADGVMQEAGHLDSERHAWDLDGHGGADAQDAQSADQKEKEEVSVA